MTIKLKPKQEQIIREEIRKTATPESLYVSVLPLSEIRRGIKKLQSGNRRTLLENWLVKDLREWFENRVLVIDEAVATRWERSPLPQIERALHCLSSTASYPQLPCNTT